MSVFGSIFHAMFVPKRSPELLINGKGKTFVCLLLSTIIAFILTYAIPYSRMFDRAIAYVQEEIPFFHVSSAGLAMDKPYVFDAKPLYIRLDNTTNYVSTDFHLLHDYSAVFVCDASQIHIILSGEQAHVPYSNLRDFSLSPQYLLSNLNILQVIWALILLAWFIFFHIGCYLSALIYAIPALIFNAVFRANLTFGEVYKLSLYALFSPLILQGILTLRFGTLLSTIISPLFALLPLILLGLYIFFLRRTKSLKHQNIEETTDDTDAEPPIIHM